MYYQNTFVQKLDLFGQQKQIALNEKLRSYPILSISIAPFYPEYSIFSATHKVYFPGNSKDFVKELTKKGGKALSSN